MIFSNKRKKISNEIKVSRLAAGIAHGCWKGSIVVVLAFHRLCSAVVDAGVEQLGIEWNTIFANR